MIKNDFRAVTHLSKWVIATRREQLIVKYIIPIIENVINNQITKDPAKINIVSKIIEIALEYGIEADKIKKLRSELQSR